MDLDSYKNIAFFPLNICLLPGEDIPLKIFEPRYKQLINDCEKEKFTFGIPFMFKNEMQMFGTEVKLNQIVARNSHDEMVIMVEGVRNFEMIRYHEKYGNKLYSGGTIRVMDPSFKIANAGLIKIIKDYSSQLDPDFFKKTKEKDGFSSNEIAKTLNLSSEDKFRFLRLEDNCDRERFLKSQLDYLFKLREQEKLLNNDFYLN